MDNLMLALGAFLLLRKPKDEKADPKDSDGSGEGSGDASFGLQNQPGDYETWEDAYFSGDPSEHIGPGAGFYRDPLFPIVGIPGIQLPTGPSAAGLPGTSSDGFGSFGGGGGDISGSPVQLTNRQQLSASDNTLQYAIASLPAAVAQKWANVQSLYSFQTRAAKQNLSLIQRKINFHKRVLKKIF